MSCENCIFSSPRPPRKLRIEEWEEDPRPISPGGWRWLWNPGKYKDKEPYIDHWDKTFDEARRRDNEILIYCDRFPERKVVLRTYKCGEFNQKEQTC